MRVTENNADMMDTAPPPLYPGEANIEQQQPFSLLSNCSTLRSLLSSIQHLSGIRDQVEMGNIKFESLCHGLSSSLQEISLRLVKMSEADKEIRCQVLSCRKQLLELASSVVQNSQHPFKALAFIDNQLASACSAALEVTERHHRKSIVDAAGPALESLEALEKSSGYKSLFANIKQFSSRLHAFLELAAGSCQDLTSEKARNDIVARSDTIKKLLPVIVQSLRESLRHPMNSHTRSDREYFFRIVRVAVQDIARTFQQDCCEKRHLVSSSSSDEAVGMFITKLDAVIKHCEEHLDSASSGVESAKISADIEWLVKFALSVAKVSRLKDEEEITEACHCILREGNNLQRALEERGSSSGDVCNAQDLLRDSVETVEQVINNALLKLIVDLFCNPDNPLDELIHHILKSSISPPDRLPEDVDDLVASFDDRSDLLFHMAHFSAFCTTDKVRSLAISSSLHLMQELEGELIPASLKLYFNPDDHGARFHLRSVRNLWMQEVEQLEGNVLGIVDATAFCYVIHQEARNEAALVKKEQYSQDKAWIHDHCTRLVRMCQRAVDFAWKDLSNMDEQHLPDDHPIVKVERSTWEVQGSLRLVLNNIEDLNLHKTMIRRVQVLVTCLGIMSHFLVNKNDTSVSVSRVKVLTSVSRITIGQDSKMVLTSNVSGAAGVSRSKAMSFRSVRRRDNNNSSSILQSRREQQEGKMSTDSRLVDQSMAVLAREAQETVPFHTRKMTRVIVSGGGSTPSRTTSTAAATATSRTGFDFTEIFDELSALSKDISKSLDCEDEKESVGSAMKAVAASSKKDMSLRQMAFKNNALRTATMENADERRIIDPSANVGIGTPERIRDIKSLDAKLAAIRSDLEGTEY